MLMKNHNPLLSKNVLYLILMFIALVLGVIYTQFPQILRSEAKNEGGTGGSGSDRSGNRLPKSGPGVGKKR